MKKYSSYKDSGVKWLGQIPSHWEVKRLASFFTERRVKVSDKDYEPLSVTKLGIFPQLENVAKTNDGDNRKLVKKGDFVINSRSDRKGSSGVSNLDGSVSLINIVLEPRKSVVPSFVNYLLKSYRFVEEYYRNGHGIVADLWTTRYDEMKMIKLGIPPLSEQTLIATYLDTATAKIDAAILQQQKMIDLLKERKQIIINSAVTRGLDKNVKMKDSGVEWIGEIPEHWEVKPIIHFKSTEKNAFVDGPFGSNLKSEHYIENGDVYVIESGMVTTGKFINKGFKTISLSHFKTIERSECKPGDVIIAKIGAKFGMAAELPNIQKKCVVSGNSLKITLNQKIMLNTLFVYYMGLAKTKNGFIGLYQETAQPALSLGGLNNMNFPVPPIEEQKEIVDFMNFKLDKIDRAITNCDRQIALLQERKQIIINDVVTGKVKVG